MRDSILRWMGMADLVRLTETAKEGLWGVEDLALANPEREEERGGEKVPLIRLPPQAAVRPDR